MFEHDYRVMGMTRTLIDTIDHQNIGGKEIQLEFGLTKTEVAQLAILEGNWACKNFMERRKDFNKNFKHNLYYGKVGNLGYIVAEDEFKDNEVFGYNPLDNVFEEA